MWPIEKLLPAAAFIAPVLEDCDYPTSGKRVGRPTAASALQLLKVCEYVKRNCHELEVPMLIVHGGEDMICDPEGAKFLYESSTSKDKTLKIFTGMWHQWTGEPNDSAEQVFNTILSWIEVRVDLSNTE
ncbi:alpha/beta-hydrolase superfamily protein [Forsythia ovata]|uniref:Alpha/beta-hydrolase superfamily protein n=1 Tax=Forsythia ovata TaxID=205694 RepID=A0ABD1R7W9_9LAMI